MIGQTIPSTVPGTRPASPPSTFTELAQTGGPEWVVPAVKCDERSMLFSLADGKSITDAAWKVIKPDRALPFVDDAESSP